MYKLRFILASYFIIVPIVHAAKNEPLLQINPQEYNMGELLTGEKRGLLVGSPSFADNASRSRSQPKMEDNLFTSPKGNSGRTPRLLKKTVRPAQAH